MHLEIAMYLLCACMYYNFRCSNYLSQQRIAVLLTPPFFKLKVSHIIVWNSVDCLLSSFMYEMNQFHCERRTYFRFET